VGSSPVIFSQKQKSCHRNLPIIVCINLNGLSRGHCLRQFEHLCPQLHLYLLKCKLRIFSSCIIWNMESHLKLYRNLNICVNIFLNSWFQTFAVIWILYMFFWVFPQRQIVVGWRFGNLYQFHLQRLGVQCEVWEEARYFIYPYRGSN